MGGSGIVEGETGLQVKECVGGDGSDLFRIKLLNITALDEALVIGSRDWILRITNSIPYPSKQISRVASWQKGKRLVVVSIPVGFNMAITATSHPASSC